MDEPEGPAQDLRAEGLEDQSGVVGTVLKSHGPYVKCNFCFPLLVNVGLTLTLTLFSTFKIYMIISMSKRSHADHMR